MNKNIFGWSYPPGVSERDIDEHFGDEDDECTHPDTYPVCDPPVPDGDGGLMQYCVTYCRLCGENLASGYIEIED